MKRLLDRVGTLLKKGAGVALAPAPDPRVTQLTSHQRQRALLNQVVRAGREVTAAKQGLRAAAEAVRAKLPAMEDQARGELKAGHEEMARLSLQRRQVVAALGVGRPGDDETEGLAFRAAKAAERLDAQLQVLRPVDTASARPFRRLSDTSCRVWPIFPP